MITYSFVIPHKNVPQLLERCIASIPERTDTEIIIVDDNSENIKEIENKSFTYRKNLQFIKLNESKGAGYARNLGITKATGKWLLFADADDFYTENLNLLLDKYKDDETNDVIYLNAQAINEQGITTPLPIERYIRRYRNNKFYSEKVLRFENWVPWTRMVKKELVEKHDIKYEEIPVGNDAMFCLTCSKHAKNIDTELNVIYNYYKPSAGSCTFHYYNIKSFESRLYLCLRINKLYSQSGYAIKRSIIQFKHSNKSFKQEKEYNEICQRVLNENSHNVIIDIFNTAVSRMAKLLGIV